MLARSLDGLRNGLFELFEEDDPPLTKVHAKCYVAEAILESYRVEQSSWIAAAEAKRIESAGRAMEIKALAASRLLLLPAGDGDETEFVEGELEEREEALVVAVGDAER